MTETSQQHNHHQHEVLDTPSTRSEPDEDHNRSDASSFALFKAAQNIDETEDTELGYGIRIPLDKIKIGDNDLQQEQLE